VGRAVKSRTAHHCPVIGIAVVDDGVGDPGKPTQILDALDNPLRDMDVTLAGIVRCPGRKTFTRQNALGILTGERYESCDYLPALRSSR
jgi:hypothetical protein